MNTVEFKNKAKIELVTELGKYQNGEIQWNVSNQFNETILESAIENLDNGIESAFTLYNGKVPSTIIDLAHYVSEFEAPELESAWIN